MAQNNMMPQMQMMQQMMSQIPGLEIEEGGSGFLTIFLLCCCCCCLSSSIYAWLSISSNKKAEGGDISDINTYKDIDPDDLILQTDRLKGLYTSDDDLDECDENDFECLIKDMNLIELDVNETTSKPT
jgi:hypothetical protein